MPSTSRSKTTNTVLYALLTLLVIGLGGFGAQNFSGSVRGIGKVGDREISVTTYANAMKQEMNRFSQQVGVQMTFQQAQAIGLDRSVRTQVVTLAALDNEADRLGVSVGDERVRTALLAIPAFRGLDGSFDREAYAFTLKQNGLTEREFEAQVRDETARALLQGAIVGGVSAPASYTNVIYAYTAEKRGFRLIRLDAANLANPVGEPDDAAIKAYYEANPAPFTRPEAKAITYVKLLPEMLIDKVTIDEQALKDLYQSRIAEFVQPERRLMERLVFGTEAEAAAAKARIDSGAVTFDALVAERGLTLSDIDLGDQSKSDLGPAGDAIFALTEPGIVGPFGSALGPALFRMNGILAAQETTFDQARDQLKPELALDEARKMISAMLGDIEDRLAGGATLEELAQETDLDLGTIDYYAGVADPIASYATFTAAADALTADAFPEIIDTEDGGILALRLDSIKPAALKPLPDVRDQVIAAWKTAETQARLKERAAEVTAALASGATAESLGLIAKDIAPDTRDAVIDAAPANLMAAVFKTTEGETTAIEEPGAVTLILLSKIIPADTLPPADGSDAAAKRSEIDSQMAQSIAGDLFDLFATALEADAGIKLDEAAINAVNAQFQ